MRCSSTLVMTSRFLRTESALFGFYHSQAEVHLDAWCTIRHESRAVRRAATYRDRIRSGGNAAA